ncbi:MAG: carboxypeptidase-like regulatory domain-containing protein [Gemmatimonadota bacterium]
MILPRRLPAAALLVLAALVTAPGAAQELHELRGQVVDSLTGAPVAGALIRMPMVRRHTITNAEGWFRFTGLQARIHYVAVAQLGYRSVTPAVMLPQAAPLVIRITPEPVVLEAIRVYNDRLHRDALRRGQFFRAFDRGEILATGAADGLEFLRLGPRMPIVLCDKNDHQERLCTRRPFDGATGASLMGGVYRAGALQAPRSRVLALLDLMGRYDALAAVKGLAYPPVFLDDHLLPGGLAALEAIPMSTLHRVETFGTRGELEIRLYTAAYLEELATGAERPMFAVPSTDVYEPPVTVLRPDTARG